MVGKRERLGNFAARIADLDFTKTLTVGPEAALVQVGEIPLRTPLRMFVTVAAHLLGNSFHSHYRIPTIPGGQKFKVSHRNFFIEV